ncbi:MAG: hypothetical protein JO250_06015 [Armatimonadetes bacterium]|nr:hypothetical protein [Armatimonadota bacterium]
MSGPSSDPLIQKLQVLVGSPGYNYYNDKNKMRADDLLVRQRASAALAEGARALAALEPEYRRRFLPPATRENPYPPVEAMESLRALGRLRARLDDLAAQILGMPVPAQDKTWWRFRDEKALLARLLDFDYQLLLQTSAIGEEAHTLTADAWQSGTAQARFDTLLGPLDTLIHDRQQLLTRM